MTLNELAIKYATDKSSKAHNYTQFYQLFFESIRDIPMNVLEIGVATGASLRMWKEYFSKSIIYGMDLSENHKQYEEDRIKVLVGNQSDKQFLKSVINSIGMFDIIIDDGSHISCHQIASFESLFSNVKPGGFYVIEDLHASYNKQWRVNSPISIMDLLKNLIDDVNVSGKCRNSNKPSSVKILKSDNISVSYYEENIEYMFFSQGLCIIKKMGV